MIKKQAIKWDQKLALIWKKFPSPARPSKGEVKIFGKYLHFQASRNKKLKVLILGSTPELRNLCLREQYDTYCVDFNKNIYKALSGLLKCDNSREKFIETNWLDFKLPVKFDAVIGDNATGMLSSPQYSEFFLNIYKHTTINGLFITRPMIQNKDFLVTPQDSIKYYRRHLKNINIFTATHNHFLHYFLDTKKSEYSMLVLYEKLKNLYARGMYTTKEYRKLAFYYQANNITISVPNEKYFLGHFTKYFDLKAKEFGLDYFSSYYTRYMSVEKNTNS